MGHFSTPFTLTLKLSVRHFQAGRQKQLICYDSISLHLARNNFGSKMTATHLFPESSEHWLLPIDPTTVIPPEEQYDSASFTCF